MPKSAFAANAEAKVCADAVAALLHGETPARPKLINTCYSLVAPDYGISIARVYHPAGGQLADVEGAGGVSPLDAPPDFRALEAAYEEAWFRTIAAETFGGCRRYGHCGAADVDRRRSPEELRSYTIAGDAIPASLTGAGGDPVRGRVIVLDRRLGTCLLCHTGSFPEEKFQGTLAPDLSGAGSRWSEGQLRLRLVDATRLNPDTIMPAYYRVEGLTRVGPTWLGKPILTAGQIEDVIAFLVTLHE
jgi:sulfur-oxidizing protein SoxX